MKRRRMNRIVLFLLAVNVIFLSGCKCLNNKYIHENDILYVRQAFQTSREFIYVDKLDVMKLPVDLLTNGYYNDAYPFSCGLALVMDRNNEWKYINKNGEVIIDASEYTVCWGFENHMKPGTIGLKGLAYVCKSDGDTWDFNGKGANDVFIDNGSRFGLINTKGQVVLPVEYEDIFGGISNFLPYDNIWWVRKNGLYGAVNEKLKFITPIKYTDVNLFDYGFALVKLNEFWGIINKKGKTIYPFIISEYSQFATEKFQIRTLAKQDGFWGIINEKGKIIIPFHYKRWESVQERHIVRMYKDDDSYITWDFKKDKYA